MVDYRPERPNRKKGFSCSVLIAERVCARGGAKFCPSCGQAIASAQSGAAQAAQAQFAANGTQPAAVPPMPGTAPAAPAAQPGYGQQGDYAAPAPAALQYGAQSGYGAPATPTAPVAPAAPAAPAPQQYGQQGGPSLPLPPRQ